MLQLAPPPASLQAPLPHTSALDQLDTLANAELALLARALGEHLPCELVDRVLKLRARRATLAQRLGVEPVL